MTKQQAQELVKQAQESGAAYGLESTIADINKCIRACAEAGDSMLIYYVADIKSYKVEILVNYFKEKGFDTGYVPNEPEIFISWS